MDYIIQTLEIEIARLRKAVREVQSKSFTAEDRENGHIPDYKWMESNIKKLEWAIKILKENKEDYENRFNEVFREYE